MSTHAIPYAGTPEYPKVFAGTPYAEQANSMLQNTQLTSVIFNTSNLAVLRITSEGRMIIGEGLSKEEAAQQAAKLLIASFDEQIQKMVDARVDAMKEASK